MNSTPRAQANRLRPILGSVGAMCAAVALTVTAPTASAAPEDHHTAATSRAGCTVHADYSGRTGSTVDVQVESNCSDATVSVDGAYLDPSCQPLDVGWTFFDDVLIWDAAANPEPHVC